MNGINLDYLALFRRMRDEEKSPLIILLPNFARVEARNIGYSWVISQYRGAVLIDSSCYGSFGNFAHNLKLWLQGKLEVAEVKGEGVSLGLEIGVINALSVNENGLALFNYEMELNEQYKAAADYKERVLIHETLYCLQSVRYRRFGKLTRN